MSDAFRPLVEAALFVSGRTLTVEDAAKLCNSGNLGVVRKVLEDLKQDYALRNTGIEISESEGKYVMRVKRDLEDKVMHLVPETDMAPAVLKTLALIAFEQPIKQCEVIKARGNGAYKYIKKLQDQELVEAHKSSRTKVLTVTSKFRDYFQIRDVKDLIKDRNIVLPVPQAMLETEDVAPVDEGSETTGESADTARV
jgi:segregation and condensation protein B